VVISHRPTALSALNMAMVLYEGKSIAFGPSEQIFARVRAGAGSPAAARPAAASVAAKTIQKTPVAEAVQS
jgi:ABC-type protease/lipase transport system fused ATPase/permease subunit